MRLEREDILYEDGQIIVYHKHSGIAVQTAKLGECDVVSLIKNYLKTPYAAVIHRLDQPVEGVLVFAKNKGAAADLSKQAMEKRYYAVASVSKESPDIHMENGSGKETVLVDYLLKNGKDNTSYISRKEVKDAKRAELSYRVIRMMKEQKEYEDMGRAPALLEICLKTGRHHQIRVQLSHAGMPLLGDMKYGDEDTKRISRGMGVNNVALCAYSLTFLHPVSNKKMNFKITPEGTAFQPFLPINP